MNETDLLTVIESLTDRAAYEFLSFGEFAPRHWTVETKAGGYVPFNLTPAQEIVEREYRKQLEGRGFVNLNILKCRQVTMSTYWTRKALLYVMHHEAVTALTVAHIKELPAEWLEKCRRNITETPEPFRPKQKSEQGHQLSFANGSRYHIGSAQGGFPGMGETVRFLHKSEVGRWDKPPISKNPDDVLIPLAPAMPTGEDRIGTVDVTESTGVMKGDWWHGKWQSGKDPADDAVNVFLPWFMVPTYKRDDLADDVLSLSPYEQATIKEAQRYDIGLSHSQIAWYRHALRQPPYHGNEDEFKAEYPATEDEAFMSPGASIYTAEAIRLARATVRSPIWRGNLHGIESAPSQSTRVPNSTDGECFILEYPDERYHYVIGADCMWGKKVENDWDYLHVECLETGKCVAWVRGQYLMSEWAWKLAAMGHWYNTCPVAPERNDKAGSATDGVMATLLGTVVSWRYPNIWIRSDDMRLRGFKPEDYGWFTSGQSKGQLIAFSEHETMLGGFDWADEMAVDQMATIIRHEDNSRGAPVGMHDDAWMSRLITAMVAHRERPKTDLYVEPTAPVYTPTPIEARMKRVLCDEDEE
jgi:hypothetical protein